MSVEYFLCCLDCGEGVILGKPKVVRYANCSGEAFGFSALGLSAAGKLWEPSAKSGEVLDHFLMLHRGHELRVLPGTVERFAERESFPTSWPDQDNDEDPAYDRLKFLSSHAPRPDPQADLENVSDETRKKIRRF